MMKKQIPILLAAALVATLVIVAPAPAAAHVSWFVGTNFSVGGLHFDLVFGSRGHYGRHAADFYYRTRRPISYRGVSCHGGCFRDRAHTYHHPSCGVVSAHFHRHGFSPFGLVQLLPPPFRYQFHDHFYYRSPRSYRYGPYGHRDYDRYRYDRYRYDRYRHDRYDRYRHDRYDRYRHDRYDRHRHDRYDRHRDDRYDRHRDERYDRRDHRHRDRRYAVPDRGRGGRHDYRGRLRDDDSDSDSDF